MDRKKYRTRQLVVLAMLLFVCFSYYIYQILFTPNFQWQKEDAYLYIRKGAGFHEVLDSLKKHDMIQDVKSFAFIAKLAGYQDNIKPGRYLIKANRNNIQMVRLLRNGKQDPVRLTFNNIRLKEDLAQKVGSKFYFSSDSLLFCLKDPATARLYGFDTTTFMSMFIPNTYEVYWDIKIKDFLDKMHKEYKAFWTKERLDKATAIGFTPIQVSTLASIVEAETNQQSERSRIAGLYINRLNINMPMQADPTVKYALCDFSIKRIYQIHTQIDNPYNTYKYTGLPPGPIDLPSIASIDAVLNYEKNKYLYFCASPTRLGFHDFSETYNNHVNNANRYRNYLDKEQIK
ncbi:MAG TPA: endolytic transglycosylase MltG [Cytophagaceae bacterium]|nr:endolytic transglycosylase MltG [Cytophagaceae bacterium]